MATVRTVTGPTPSGGVRSEVRFLDAEGRPCDESAAVRGEAVEYSEGGEVLRRTYMEFGRGAAHEDGG